MVQSTLSDLRNRCLFLHRVSEKKIKMLNWRKKITSWYTFIFPSNVHNRQNEMEKKCIYLWINLKNITYVVQQDIQLLLWFNIYSQYVWQLDMFRTYRSILRSIYKLCVQLVCYLKIVCCSVRPYVMRLWKELQYLLCWTSQTVECDTV